MKLSRIFAAVLMFVGIFAVDLTGSQEQTEEMAQKDGMNLSKQKKVESQKKVRNPFLLPPGVYLLSKEGPPSSQKEGSTTAMIKRLKIDSSPLKVKAILISDHLRLATIGRFVVTIGDAIHDERVLEIKTDRVILGKGDKKRTLLLNQNPVQLTIEDK